VETLELTILLFGPARDAAGGADRVSVRPSAAAPSGKATVEDVLSALSAQHAALAPVVAAGRLAVNGAFAAHGQVVVPSDELALIALVSGG
jgi:molybdopterin converting factor small subunit